MEAEEYSDEAIPQQTLSPPAESKLKDPKVVVPYVNIPTSLLTGSHTIVVQDMSKGEAEKRLHSLCSTSHNGHSKLETQDSKLKQPKVVVPFIDIPASLLTGSHTIFVQDVSKKEAEKRLQWHNKALNGQALVGRNSSLAGGDLSSFLLSQNMCSFLCNLKTFLHFAQTTILK